MVYSLKREKTPVPRSGVFEGGEIILYNRRKHMHQ